MYQANLNWITNVILSKSKLGRHRKLPDWPDVKTFKCHQEVTEPDRLVSFQLSLLQLQKRLYICKCPSVRNTTQPLRIALIDHQAYWTLSLSTIEPIKHQPYQPSSLSTIVPINHQAYKSPSLWTIEPINLWSSFATFKPSGLFLE